MDPSGNTEQFRAFVQRTEAPPEKSGTNSRLLVYGIIAVVLLAGLVLAIVVM